MQVIEDTGCYIGILRKDGEVCLHFASGVV